MKFQLYSLQRRSLFLFFCLIVQSSLLFSQQVAKTIPSTNSPEGGVIGFLEFRPSDYGTQKHPLIIFLHGTGERGNGTTEINKVTANAIPLFCANGASMRFTVGGVTSSFVVLSPQLSNSYGYWPTFYVKEILKYAKANLQIDTNRIYITGLSLGGGGVWRSITDAWGFDYTFDAGIAAAAPVCGTQEETDADFCKTIGANKLPVWAFHSMDDGTVGVGQTQHAEILAINCGLNPAAKFTYYQSGGHVGAWVNAYDTGHITRATVVNGNVVNFTANPNMYEWFLSNKRGTTAPPTNTPPVANAGAAQIITLPLNTVTLTGSGSGTNGATISSYFWTKTSGPAAGTISVPLLNTTLVTGLVQGTYVFTLTVTDNHGLTATSSVTITVNPLPVNQAPTANAGGNINITLPTNSTILNGSASSDPDGTITTYAWTKTSGPAGYTIANPGSANTALTNLTQGTYVFTLQVTDNAGASATSNATVTVNAAANQLPVANAGGNINITLPATSTTLNGTASSDADGTITTYAWTKTSGPSSYNIVNPGSASTALNNLSQGVYVFTLNVTDNAGGTASSTVTVTVNAAANQPPVAVAGSDASITLPANATNLVGTGSNDPDGTITTYAWTKTSGPSSYNIVNPALASTWLTNLVQGVYVFKLTVTDNAGATASSSLTVTVNAAPNQPPTANAGSSINITLPTNSTTLNGSGSTDADGTIASYAWSKTSGPSAYNIVNAGSSTTALNNLVQGTYIFTLLVTDNAGATASSIVTVTVNAAPPPANQSPVAIAGSNVNITLPANNTILDGSASNDPDGTIATYAWTKISGPATFNITSAGSASTSITNLVQGVYVFSLQVTDNGGAAASSTVTVTVNAAPPPPPVNQPPVANAGGNINLTLPTNSTTLYGNSSSDTDGAIATFAWTKTSGPSTYTITDPAAAVTTLTGLVQGTYVFTLTVTDNAGASASATVTVNVAQAANQSPTANAGGNIDITLPTNSTILNGSASSDPDGTIATYAWTKTSGPASYSLSNAGSANTVLNNLVQGVYVFTLTVTDNAGASASATATVNVVQAANQAPTANAGSNIDLVLPVNSTILNGSASSDPDGTVATYAWSKASGPASYSFSNAGSATIALNNLTEGVYVFMLQVTDNAGATATSNVTVTVNPKPNEAPTANAGSDISITLPVNTATLDGSLSTDADGTIVNYVWTKSTGPASYIIAGGTTAKPTLTNLELGVYIFTLTVTDNAGATASSSVTITVNPKPNLPPIANAGADISITLPDNSTKIDGSGSYDPDGIITEYSWNKISGPGAITIVNSNTNNPTVIGLAEGVYTFELTVTDNNGTSATDQVIITVKPAPK